MRILSLRILIFLLTAFFVGTSWAENLSDIRQNGGGNDAEVKQEGQANDHNSATIVQGGLVEPYSPDPLLPAVQLPAVAIGNLALINQVNHEFGGTPTPQTAIILQGAGPDDMNLAPGTYAIQDKLEAAIVYPPYANGFNKAKVDQGTAGAFGGANFSITVQNGNNSEAHTRQNSVSNEAGIVQTNTATVSGSNLNAFIDQNNDFGHDQALIVQTGTGMSASIEQTLAPTGGTHPSAGTDFSGGGDNSAEINQNSGGLDHSDFQARILQTGSFNNSASDPATINQTGNGSELKALIYQTGDDSLHASIDQDGELNTAAIFQVRGLGFSAMHDATIVQNFGSSNNDALVWQSGGATSHTADVTQSGGTGMATVYQTQEGVAGIATVNQGASILDNLNTALVVQGDTPAGFDPATDLDALLTPVTAVVGGSPPPLPFP